MKLLQAGVLLLSLAAASSAFAQAAVRPIDLAGRCWATHTLQGERVRSGTPSAQIAAENASFWRSQIADDIEDVAQLDSFLSVNVERARADAEREPGHGLMQIVMNASTCQTLRADIQPGYDPVQQNNGN
jgi:hypothetical protein